jgi:hypothetical protein
MRTAPRRKLVAAHGCRVVVASSVLLLVAMMSIGCSASRPSPPAVRVGGIWISKRSVAHWTSLIERGAIVADVSASSQQSPRQQALALLISSAWLAEEAAQEGLALSSGMLAHIVGKQEGSAPGGRAEFQATLAASGETLSDVRLEAHAQWAASAFARRLAETTRKRASALVTDEAVSTFYRSHIAQYSLRERRHYDLIESIPSRAAARALAARLGPGKRFAAVASKELPFRPSSFNATGTERAVLQAVFKAKVGVLVGPTQLNHRYALFVLRRVEPARVQPLSEVRGAIERQLLVRDSREISAELVAVYRKKWTGQTDCQPGYIVQKCKQYTGPRAPERPPFSGY